MSPLPDKLNRTIAPKMGKVVKTEIDDLVYQFEMIYLKETSVIERNQLRDARTYALGA